MAQWASAFTESALGVSKTVGDLAGPCLFAVFMGITRVIYGKRSEKIDLRKIMLVCGAMWPGTISISSQKCPRGGTALFAFLALAGDFGATVSPALVGSISEVAGGNLKMGLLVATVFPVALVAGLIVLKKCYKNS